MPQDAFTLRYIAKELDSTLKGGRVNKIVQPSRDEISLLLYAGRRVLRLVLCTGAQDCGAYFSDTEPEVPLVAPNFCMLLRKHLQSAELLSVTLVGFERILMFTLRCVSDFSTCERQLYLEVMGKYSNLVLVENGVILGALKTTSLDMTAKRMIFPGVKYELPAPQDKVNPLDEGALRAVCTHPEGDLAHYLFTRISGIAPVTAAQIAGSFRGGDLAEHVKNFIFSEEVSPCVQMREGLPCEFSAHTMSESTPFESLLDAEKYYYGERKARKDLEARARRLGSVLSAALKKQEKRLAQTLDKQRECADCELLRVKGELLTANLYALHRGMQGVELENWENGKPVKITLDATLSPAQNAQSYFKRYRKQKRTLEMLAPQEAETRAELEYLKSLQAEVNSAETMEDLASAEEELLAAGLLKAPQERTKKKAEIAYRTYQKDGFTVFAGRNNLQNDRLVRGGSPEDVWLHARQYHSCHVLIKTEGRAVPDSVIAFAAALAAKYSDAHGERIPVDCCKLKYVKKPPKSRAGFVTYSQFTTVLGDIGNL